MVFVLFDPLRKKALVTPILYHLNIKSVAPFLNGIKIYVCYTDEKYVVDLR
ncbi:MAG: hypothetical protein HEEMFOPI_01891 [Holosporales bacterium]